MKPHKKRTTKAIRHKGTHRGVRRGILVEVIRHTLGRGSGTLILLFSALVFVRSVTYWRIRQRKESSTKRYLSLRGADTPTTTSPSDTLISPWLPQSHLGFSVFDQGTYSGGERTRSESQHKSRGLLRIFTGTHGLGEVLPLANQHEACLNLSLSLHNLWSAFDTSLYAQLKRNALSAMRNVTTHGAVCNLNGSEAQGMVWSFPLAHTPSADCQDHHVRSALRHKPWTRDTKVHFPWFLLRPDLVTLDRLSASVGLRVEIFVNIGHDTAQATIAQETKCPRFNTVLDTNGEVYRQRLLLVGVSDIAYQLHNLKHAAWTINLCSHTSSSSSSSSAMGNELNTPVLSHDNSAAMRRLDRMARTARDNWAAANAGEPPKCPSSRDVFSESQGQSALAAVAILPPLLHQQVRKTYFTGPRLVFVAGLEGVGHHLFSVLARSQTYRYIYEALTVYLCDSAWGENSVETSIGARERLVEAMKRIKESHQHDIQIQSHHHHHLRQHQHSHSGKVIPTTSTAAVPRLDVVFLNTVFAQQAVNMYSFPWGGPRCQLKRFARVMCNVDLVGLARMAEEAQVDLRIVVLRREIGAAVVSAAVHRPYGNVASETRMLAQSWGLLRTAMGVLDPRFVLQVNYEDLMDEGASMSDAHGRGDEKETFDKVSPDIILGANTKALLDHIVPPDSNSVLSTQLPRQLAKSATGFSAHAMGHWKTEVTNADLEYMTDLLNLRG